MAEQVKCVRITRLAKKRSAEAVAMADDLSATNKKRVVLGELRNLSNTIALADPSLGKPKRVTKTKKVKKAVLTMKPSIVKKEENNENTTSLDDPQMCGPYVSDIYAYLHKMEVMGFSFFFLLIENVEFFFFYFWGNSDNGF